MSHTPKHGLHPPKSYYHTHAGPTAPPYAPTFKTPDFYASQLLTHKMAFTSDHYLRLHTITKKTFDIVIANKNNLDPSRYMYMGGMLKYMMNITENEITMRETPRGALTFVNKDGKIAHSMIGRTPKDPSSIIPYFGCRGGTWERVLDSPFSRKKEVPRFSKYTRETVAEAAHGMHAITNIIELNKASMTHTYAEQMKEMARKVLGVLNEIKYETNLTIKGLKVWHAYDLDGSHMGTYDSMGGPHPVASWSRQFTRSIHPPPWRLVPPTSLTSISALRKHHEETGGIVPFKPGDLSYAAAKGGPARIARPSYQKPYPDVPYSHSPGPTTWKTT